MVSRKPYIIFSLCFVLMAFQNCDDKANGDVLPFSSEGEIVRENSLDGVDNILLSGGNAFISPSSFSVELRLSDGTIIMSPTNPLIGAPAQQFCVPQEKMDEVEDLLLKTPICYFPENQDPNIMCTMAIVFPHTVLHMDDGSEQALGGKNNGCGATYDFCGPNAPATKALLYELKSEFQTYSCP